MDVLTQLEQACAHGSVLLSETFAVALRPADPTFSGDGFQSSTFAVTSLLGLSSSALRLPNSSALRLSLAGLSSSALRLPLVAAPALTTTLGLGTGDEVFPHARDAEDADPAPLPARLSAPEPAPAAAAEPGANGAAPVRLSLSLAAAPLGSGALRRSGAKVRRMVTVRRLGVRRAPSYPDDTSAPADFYFSSPSAPYPGGASLTSLDGDASGVISGVGLDGAGPPGASGALGVAQSSVFDLVPSNEINFVGAFGLCMSPSGLEVPLSVQSRRKNGLWEPSSGQNPECLVPFSWPPSMQTMCL